MRQQLQQVLVLLLGEITTNAYVDIQKISKRDNR